MSKHIVFVLGEPEYESHLTMPHVAEEWAKQEGIKATLCITDTIPDNPDFPESHFQGLEALADADLMVIYTRFRVLPAEQMDLLKSYLDSGRPVVGLRTSTHAFKFPEGSPFETWNNGFGINVLGAPWISHHGHDASTDVTVIPEAKDHAILEGVDEAFHVRSWLYKMLPYPGEDATQLLWGVPVDPQNEPQENPVAWTRLQNGGRVLYTSMGHPEDFDVAPFRRLLDNGIRWALEG